MTDIPVYDRALALTLAGHQANLANEMLAGLLQTLPHTLAVLQDMAQAQQYHVFKKELHRLRGLICYCGTPRLQAAATHLDKSLQETPLTDFDAYFHDFLEEANRLVKHIKTN